MKIVRLARTVIFCAGLWGPTAFAQTPASYTLTVNSQQVDLIGRALGKEPYIDVRDLIGQLQSQIALQNEAAKKAAAPDPKPAPPAESEH